MNDSISYRKIALIFGISLAAVGVLLLVIFFVFKLIFNEQITYYHQKSAEYAAENANLDTGGTVLIGDSLVEWYPLEEHFNGRAIRNRGIKNDTTLGVLNRLQTSVFDLKPRVIIIMIGTNDISTPRSINAIIKTYKEIVYSIFDDTPTSTIYVMSVPPQNKDFEKTPFVNVDNNMKRIRELNAKLEAFCDSCAAVYVDLFDLLVDENGYLNKAYSDDGLHLNNDGYTVWTNLIKNKIL